MRTYRIKFIVEAEDGALPVVKQVDLVCDHLPGHAEIMAQRPPEPFSFYIMESVPDEVDDDETIITCSSPEVWVKTTTVVDIAKEVLEHAIDEGHIDDSPDEC